MQPVTFWSFIYSRCIAKLQDITLGDVQQRPLQDGPCLLLHLSKVPALACWLVPSLSMPQIYLA